MPFTALYQTQIIPDLFTESMRTSVAFIDAFSALPPGGYKKMPFSLAVQIALVYESKCGGGGSRWVSANEYNFTQEPK